MSEQTLAPDFRVENLERTQGTISTKLGSCVDNRGREGENGVPPDPAPMLERAIFSIRICIPF